MYHKAYLCILLISVALNVPGSLAQETGYDSKGNPAWVSTPKPMLDAKKDTIPKNIRLARSYAFNLPQGRPLYASSPNASDANVVTGGFHDFSKPDPLPVGESDAIVVAQATSSQAFLSADHARIYSELTVTPEMILKDSTASMAHSQQWIIIQEGGTLKLPKGKLISSAPFAGSNPIRLGTKYLLFLQYSSSLKSFSVIRSWDLSTKRPREMDNDGHSYDYRPEAIENDIATRDELLALVKSRIRHD